MQKLAFELLHVVQVAASRKGDLRGRQTGDSSGYHMWTGQAAQAHMVWVGTMWVIDEHWGASSSPLVVCKLCVGEQGVNVILGGKGACEEQLELEAGALSPEPWSVAVIDSLGHLMGGRAADARAGTRARASNDVWASLLPPPPTAALRVQEAATKRASHDNNAFECCCCPHPPATRMFPLSIHMQQ